MDESAVQFDEIGYWSEIKLEIVKKYASAYSKILSNQKSPPLHHVYIDAFSGAGIHRTKGDDRFVQGSPIIALSVEPRFKEFHFIDLNKKKLAALKERAGNDPDIHYYAEDCNDVLLRDVFPLVEYKDYRRGLCLLDPYGLHLDWSVIERAGKMETIDIFLNFPTMDMNMNVLWNDPEKVDPEQAKRLTRFWGDASWREAAYEKQRDLFDEIMVKRAMDEIANSFRTRLKKIAGFGHVPEPIPMRNTTGAIVYYLFFASQKPVASRIVDEIFDKFRDRGRK